MMKEVPAGRHGHLRLAGDIEGVFEAELEGHKEQIIELTVKP